MIEIHGSPAQAKKALKRRIEYAEEKLKQGYGNPDVVKIWIKVCKEILEEIPKMGMSDVV